MLLYVHGITQLVRFGKNIKEIKSTSHNNCGISSNLVFGKLQTHVLKKTWGNTENIAEHFEGQLLFPIYNLISWNTRSVTVV